MKDIVLDRCYLENKDIVLNKIALEEIDKENLFELYKNIIIEVDNRELTREFDKRVGFI